MTKLSTITNHEVRYENQRRILSFLRRGTYSCSELNKLVGLSNTAIENIVDEMEEMNLVSYFKKYKKTRGRTSIQYHVNPAFGVVAVVDLSKRDLMVCISNVDTQILYREEIKQVVYITDDILQQVISIIKNGMQKPEIAGMPLRCICIASPGKIDAKTGKFKEAFRFEDYETLNLKEYFQNHFDCQVIVRRDVQCGLMGEMRFGVMAEGHTNSSIFLNFDIVLAVALLLDGQIYQGSSALAGEVGFVLPDLSHTNKGLDDFVSLTAMMIKIKEEIAKLPYKHALSDKFVLNKEEIQIAFLSGDKTVDGVVKEVAKSLAIQLLNWAYLLDVWCVVIDGGIIGFGEKFLSYVEQYIQEYNRSSEKMTVCYSTLMNRATILGCIDIAIEGVFDEILRSCSRIMEKK